MFELLFFMDLLTYLLDTAINNEAPTCVRLAIPIAVQRISSDQHVYEFEPFLTRSKLYCKIKSYYKERTSRILNRPKVLKYIFTLFFYKNQVK